MRSRPFLFSLLLAIPALAEDEWAKESGLENGIQAVHSATPSLAFAGGSEGRLLRSRDGGATWTPLPAATLRRILAIHGPDARTLVAAGAEGALIRSTDGGETWHAVPTGTQAELRALRFVDATTAYAAGMGGVVLHSTDGGASWRPTASPARADLNALHFLDARIGFVAGAGRSIYRTSDGGSTWKAAPFTDDTLSTSEFQVRWIHFEDPRTGFIGGAHITYTGSGKHRTYFNIPNQWITRDGGETWKPRPGPAPNLVLWKGAGAGVGFFSSRISITHDFGETWDSVANMSTKPWVGYRASATTFSGHSAIVATGIGPLWHSRDGGMTWHTDSVDRSISRGGASFPIRGLHFPSRSTGFAVGGYSVSENPARAARTSDGGLTWTDLPPPGPFLLNAVQFLDTLRGFVVGGGKDSLGIPHASLLGTTDGGATWQDRSGGRQTVLEALSFPSSRIGFAAGEKGTLLATEDGGETWNPLPVQPVDFLALQFLDDTIGFAGGGHAGGIRAGGSGTSGYGMILGTSDGGRSWRKLDEGSPANLVVGLQFLTPRLGYTLEWNRGLRKTTDGGATWTTVLSGHSLSSMRFTSPDSGFVAGDSIWRTWDGGRTWSPRIEFYAEGRSAIAMPDARSAFAGTSRGELFRMLDPAQAPVTIRSAPGRTPTGAPLLELLPGRVAFALSRSTRVTAVIVDVRGRYQVRLADGTLGAGRHSLPLPASPCGSSPCFLDFRAGAFRQALSLGRAYR